jgi:hypothetical protein
VLLARARLPLLTKVFSAGEMNLPYISAFLLDISAFLLARGALGIEFRMGLHSPTNANVSVEVEAGELIFASAFLIHRALVRESYDRERSPSWLKSDKSAIARFLTEESNV